MDHLEYTDCNLCHSNDYAIIYKSGHSDNGGMVPQRYLCTEINKGDFGTVVQCRQCGLMYNNPRLKPQVAKELYVNSADPLYVKEQKQRIESFRRTARECEKIKSGGNLLDIGSFYGFFLEAASKEKWQRYGVELSKNAIFYTRKHFGIDVFEGDLFAAHYPDRHFDLVTMWDVIEHLHNPKETLLEINRVLKDDGLLALVTPNINSFMARIFKDQWWFLVPSHIYYFTPRTIGKMLNEAGFKMIRKGTYGRSFTLSYWATKIEPYNRRIYGMIDKVIRSLKMGQWPLNLNLGDHMLVFAQKKTTKGKDS